MAVVLPREGRYLPNTTRYDWSEMRRRLEAEPGEWVLPLEAEVSNGTVSWLRKRGPILLADINHEIEYRLRGTHLAGNSSTVVGTLYARWTPGQTAPPYVRGDLTPEQVVAIREEYAAGGISQQALGDKHGVGTATINRIVRGLSYTTIGGPIS